MLNIDGRLGFFFLSEIMENIRAQRLHCDLDSLMYIVHEINSGHVQTNQGYTVFDLFMEVQCNTS